MTGDTLRVDGGLIAGSGGDVRAFKGVPYARPPIGGLRWREPQSVEAWTGIRDATAFGPRCVQPERPATAIGYFGPERESEDCLYLNVWTAARAADERRPVMVWFHGGAYAVGSGSLPIFDGERLARRGAIVVTVNYRLGRLGFLAHPGLTRQSPHRASGNYGLLDQQAALGWVRRNIAAFGGDPGRVTIFGQSVGSTSVHCHMVSPPVRGLFQRAIGQSGGGFGRSLLDLDAAERAGDAFARRLGALSIDALRAQPARTVQLARADGGGLREIYDSADADAIDHAIAWPIIDGHVLTEQLDDSFSRGMQADVPLITGSTADEGATQPGAASLQTYLERATAEHGSAAASFLKLYPATTDDEARAASRRAGGDRTFAWQNWWWAHSHATAGRSRAYYYHFSRVPPRPLVGASGDAGRALGAFHTAEIPYVFDHLAARDWPWREIDRRLAEEMSAYWVNFAASGDPNGTGLPTWPSVDAAAEQTMIFGDATGAGPHPAAARIAFWHDQARRGEA